MSLLLGLGSIVVAGLALYRWLRPRPGRAHLFAPPHTPPTVPWRVAPRERQTDAADRGEER